MNEVFSRARNALKFVHFSFVLLPRKRPSIPLSFLPACLLLSIISPFRFPFLSNQPSLHHSAFVLPFLCCFADSSGVRQTEDIWQIRPTADTGGHPLLADVFVEICERRKVSVRALNFTISLGVVARG